MCDLYRDDSLPLAGPYNPIQELFVTSNDLILILNAIHNTPTSLNFKTGEKYMTESINRSVSMEGGLYNTVSLQLVMTNKKQRLTGVDQLLSALDQAVDRAKRRSLGWR